MRIEATGDRVGERPDHRRAMIADAVRAPSSHNSQPWRYVLGDDRIEMHELPALARVLAVCAHPDDESFGLGAIIAAFTEAGAAVGVLCFTHGEGSTLHGADGSLGEIRARELAAAGRGARGQPPRAARPSRR